MKRLLFVVAIFSGLAACSSSTINPVGVGTGVNDLKKSPCACAEIEMAIPQAAG